MKFTHLAITLALTATAVYAIRHRELVSLGRRSESLRLNLQKQTPSGTSAPSILTSLKTLISTGEPSEAASMDLDARMETLSLAEVRTLMSAALREPDPSSKILTDLARRLASTGTGQYRGLAFDLFLELHLREEGKNKALERGLYDWLLTDPSASAVWLRQALAGGKVTDPKLERKLKADLAKAEVWLAPVASLPRLRTLPSDEQKELLGYAMWGANTPADIRTLAAAIISWPSAEGKDQVFGATMEKLQSLGDFPATIAWIHTLPDATPAQKREAFMTLAVRDPNAVANIRRNAACLLSVTDAAEQPELAAQLTAEWIQADHDATGTWLNTNRAAPWYDAAACAFAEGVSRKEPVTGFDWALTISDESLRRKALTEVMRLWNKNDTAAASSYLEASSLPPDWKQELRAAR